MTPWIRRIVRAVSQEAHCRGRRKRLDLKPQEQGDPSRLRIRNSQFAKAETKTEEGKTKTRRRATSSHSCLEYSPSPRCLNPPPTAFGSSTPLPRRIVSHLFFLLFLLICSVLILLFALDQLHFHQFHLSNADKNPVRSLVG